jgi:two-component system sensor histidine kinase YesM
MVITFSLIMCFLITCVVYFSTFVYTNKLKDNNISLSMKVIDTLIGSFSHYLENVDNLSRVASYNRYLQQYLANYKSDTYSDYYSESMYKNLEISFELFGNILNTQKEIESIIIVDEERTILYKAINLNVNRDPYYKSNLWYQNALLNDGSSVVTGPYISDDQDNPQKSKVFTISRIIKNYDQSKTLGVLAITINLSILYKYIQSIEDANLGALMILNEEGAIVYESSKLQNPSEKNLVNIRPASSDTESILRLKQGAFITKINDQPYQIIFNTMPKTNWTVLNITPYSEFSKEVNIIRRFVFLLGLFSLIATILLTLLLSSSITRPIVQLTRRLNLAAKDNLYTPMDFASNDEIGQMAKSFDRMLIQIDTLINQTIKDQEIKRKLELTSLQHQINPHFLYNTLDSIIWMVESQDENTIPLIEALSGLFRISLSKGSELITLAKELEHAKNYLFIQSMRYLNKFTFDIQADPALLHYLTPKLLLQPLIENSIYHGIKPKREKSHIAISVKELDDNILILIEDNGIGMDEAKLSYIFDSDYIKEHSHGGVGVNNVNSRIKLYFGPEYGLSFNSAATVGTTVTVKLSKTLPLP